MCSRLLTCDYSQGSEGLHDTLSVLDRATADLRFRRIELEDVGCSRVDVQFDVDPGSRERRGISSDRNHRIAAGAAADGRTATPSPSNKPPNQH